MSPFRAGYGLPTLPGTRRRRQRRARVQAYQIHPPTGVVARPTRPVAPRPDRSGVDPVPPVGHHACMADEHPVTLTSGSPDTVLPALAPDIAEALASAGRQPAERRKAAVAEVAARWPDCLQAWAALAAIAQDPVEQYAYARTGYHRGLDALRASGGVARGWSAGATPKTGASCDRSEPSALRPAPSGRPARSSGAPPSSANSIPDGPSRRSRRPARLTPADDAGTSYQRMISAGTAPSRVAPHRPYGPP